VVNVVELGLYIICCAIDCLRDTDTNDIACGDERPAELTASRGTIRSPGYEENTYPNKALCHWHIKAPPGKVSINH